jgi:hypothetical protein
MCLLRSRGSIRCRGTPGTLRHPGGRMRRALQNQRAARPEQKCKYFMSTSCVKYRNDGLQVMKALPCRQLVYREDCRANRQTSTWQIYVHDISGKAK